MTISPTTVFVVIANGITAVVAVALLMLVLWQAPRQRANQWFAVTMASLAAYVVSNAFARFVDPLAIDPQPVLPGHEHLQPVRGVDLFFASEFAAGRPRDPGDARGGDHAGGLPGDRAVDWQHGDRRAPRANPGGYTWRYRSAM